MTQVNLDLQFAVSLNDCAEGDCVRIEISGVEDSVFLLSPQQARTFASELIQTVYRAEVKNSLQRQSAPVIKVERAIDHYGATPHPV